MTSVSDVDVSPLDCEVEQVRSVPVWHVIPAVCVKLFDDLGEVVCETEQAHVQGEQELPGLTVNEIDLTSKAPFEVVQGHGRRTPFAFQADRFLWDTKAYLYDGHFRRLIDLVSVLGLRFA